MNSVKLHLSRDDPRLFGLRTPNGGAPPTGYDPTPKIITDPKLIQQLRDAMPPKPKPNHRTPQHTRPNPAAHQQPNRYFIPLTDLQTANCHYVDGVATLQELATTHNVPTDWLLAQWRNRRWPTTPKQPYTPPTEEE